MRKQEDITMNKKTSEAIKNCMPQRHNPLPGATLGYAPGTADQRRYWERKGWIEKRGMYVLTVKGWREL